jgi:hypothetical protein
MYLLLLRNSFQAIVLGEERCRPLAALGAEIHAVGAGCCVRCDAVAFVRGPDIYKYEYTAYLCQYPRSARPVLVHGPVGSASEAGKYLLIDVPIPELS